MKTRISTFGLMPGGDEVKLFTFETKKGLEISITNYGGIITSVIMPDKHSNREEITAGFPTLSDYLKGHPHFGVIVGRFANRIAKGSFAIEGEIFSLPINNGLNHLHGGDNGFHVKLWDYDFEEKNDSASLKLTYLSPHLEEGYPGNLEVSVIYTVNDNNELAIDFFAKTDTATHVNLTSHGYFNLSGFKNNIFDHHLYVNSDKYVEVDETQIPTGKLIPSSNFPFDFSTSKQLECGIKSIPGGIDHCYVLNKDKSFKAPAAILTHEESGRKLIVYCTHPGLQVYTGNSLDGSEKGHNGIVYHKNWAICMEMQHLPDSPNQPSFPSTLLKPGETYHQKAKLVFEAEG
jgi:aldose 1-epimerase